MKSKNLTAELIKKPDRLNLLRQRLYGNDLSSDSSNFSVAKEPTSSIGSTDNFNHDISLPSSRGITSEIITDDSRKSYEEEQYRKDYADQLRQEQQKKLDRMSEFALDCLFKSNIEKKKMKNIQLSEKSERLGTIVTFISGNAKWNGGTLIQQYENDIDVLQKQLESLKKTEPHKSIDIDKQRKSSIQAMIKEKRANLKQLEDERIEFAHEIRLNHDENHSDYRVNQELNEGQYVLNEFSGRGGCSEVWRAYDKTEMRFVAIKIQRMNKTWPDSVKQNFIRHTGREIMIMKSTQHQNVVAFYGYFFIGDDTLAIVMEFCNGGDLSMMLKKRGKIPEKEAKVILAQVINGLMALRSEEMYVIHYDLKPGNILFDESGTAKITDFGLSKIVEGDMSTIELTSQGTGTYYYAAPETFQKGKSVYITKSVDTWSLGIIFYEMLYGQRPFDEGQTQTQFAKQVDSTSFKPVFPQSTKVSQQGKDFINMCLIQDPSERPELSKLIDLPYIKPTINELAALQ